MANYSMNHISLSEDQARILGSEGEVYYRGNLSEENDSFSHELGLESVFTYVIENLEVEVNDQWVLLIHNEEEIGLIKLNRVQYKSIVKELLKNDKSRYLG
jgi:hypothetical protein